MYTKRTNCDKSTFHTTPSGQFLGPLGDSPFAQMELCFPARDSELKSSEIFSNTDFNPGKATKLANLQILPEISTQYFSKRNSFFSQKEETTKNLDSNRSLENVRLIKNACDQVYKNKKVNQELWRKLNQMTNIFAGAEKLGLKASCIQKKGNKNVTQSKKEITFFLERLQKDRVLKEEVCASRLDDNKDMLRKQISKNSLREMTKRCKELRRSAVQKKRLRKERTLRRLKKLREKSKKLESSKNLKEKNFKNDGFQINRVKTLELLKPTIDSDDQLKGSLFNSFKDAKINRELPNLQKPESLLRIENFSLFSSRELLEEKTQTANFEQKLVDLLDTEIQSEVFECTDSFKWKRENGLNFSPVE